MIKDDYAFVEYANANSACEALKEMNGKEFKGTKMVVEEARPKEYEN